MKDIVSIFDVSVQVFIEKSGDPKQVRYKSKILGWHENSFVLLTLPTLNGTPVTWKPGTSTIVKFIHKGNVYAFKSKTIKHQYQPTPIIFLKFPDDIENVSLRKSKRIQTHLACSLFPLIHTITMDDDDENDENEHESNATTIDLSSEGALIEFHQDHSQFIIGDRLGLNIDLPDGTYIDGLISELRNIRIDSGKKLIGVKFLDTNKDAFDSLAAFFRKYFSDD